MLNFCNGVYLFLNALKNKLIQKTILKIVNQMVNSSSSSFDNASTSPSSPLGKYSSSR